MLHSLELQRALAAALSSDPVLRAHSIPIFDGPPVEARPPYLTIGNDVVASRRWQGGEGYEHRFSVSLWDNREGLASAKALLAEAERVVLALPPRVQGLRLIGLRLLRASARRTQRGWALGQLEFRVLSVKEN